ncbi:MAG: hypothetical protein H7Y13_11625 [Sphingobacteriaceae bacterium]|nr:hypothetical protein [Sphingobacteriaceae bacterium]
MQEQATFQLSGPFLAENIDIIALKNELQSNIKTIESLLVSYHFKSRGRVFDVRLRGESIEMLQAQMGKFLVEYSVGQFNACADIDFTEKASMEMLIDLDSINKRAIITGEYIPERDPDEI